MTMDMDLNFSVAIFSNYKLLKIIEPFPSTAAWRKKTLSAYKHIR